MYRYTNAYDKAISIVAKVTTCELLKTALTNINVTCSDADIPSLTWALWAMRKIRPQGIKFILKYLKPLCSLLMHALTVADHP